MKTILKKTLSIAIMASMIISLFAVPTMAVQPELPDWEILMNPVYEMGFEPDSDGKFYDMPAGFAGRQEVPTEANPEGILLGDNNAYDKVISVGKTLNSGTNETKIASYWATDVLYSSFSKGDAANDINTGASGNVNDYCVKLTDASSNSGPGLVKIDFPQAYGATDDSYNKYRVEFDWKWQAYYDNDGVLTPTAQPSASGATLLRFYIGDKTLNLKSKSASEAADARGAGALYFVDAFGMYASNQITDAADVDKITETAAQIPESESGKWIHVTVDFDFKAGTIDLVMDGETSTTQMSTSIVNGNSDFAKGITAMAILGSTSSERRVSYADNVKVTPISRPSVPLTSGERLGNASYEMDFNPDASGNFYDAPLGYDDREVVATTSSLKMAKGEAWEGTCTKKLTPRFDSTTSYSEFVQDGTTNNYYIKSVDNEGNNHTNAGSGTAIKVDFGKTFGGADDSHRRYRVELDWKWSNISGNQLAGVTGGTLFNFYTPSGKKLYLKTKSGSDATNPGGIFFDKQNNHITGVTATQIAPQVTADKSNKWLHLTFDFDFANSLVDLTIEGEDYTGKVSATVNDSDFAGGITGLSMWGSSKADTRINYMDNVKVSPVMTKEPTVKADGNKLMWKAVAGADSYKVYASESATGEKEEVILKKLDTTSNPGYVIATLNFADDSAKYYTVTATSANKGESYHSNSVSIAPKNIISNVDFKITSAADGKSTAKASVNVEAAKGFDKKIKLIAAVYNGNELLSVSESALAEFAAGAEGKLELTLNGLTTIPTSTMYINFFVWDEDINPVKPSEKLTSEKWHKALENSGHDLMAGTIYVLSIGNSFSQDASYYLGDIAAADGVSIEAYNLYFGGRPLLTHHSRMKSDKNDYDLQRFGRPTTAEAGVSMSYAFEKHDWDYVILQGATHKNIYDNVLWDDTFTRTDGGVTTTYNSAEMLGDFKEYVEEKAPNAKRMFVAPWAPYKSLSATFNGKIFANAKPDARGAYTAGILEKSKQKAAVYATDGMYLPTAVAIDYLIRYYGFDETQGEGVVDSVDSTKIIYDNKSTTTAVYRDSTCHLTNSVGRTLAGLVWYEMITGNSALENGYTNSLPEETMNKIKAAAHYACQNYASYNPADI